MRRVSATESEGGYVVDFFIDLAPSFLEFDQDIVGGNLAEFLQLSQKLGGEVAEHAALVRKAFE